MARGHPHPNSKVKQRLAEQGRTTKWLAAQLGMERTRVEHIERGDPRYRTPPLYYERIAMILNVPVTLVRREPESEAAVAV